MLGFYSRRIRCLLHALLLCVGVKALLLCLFRYDLGQMLGVGWRSLFGFSNITLYGLVVDCLRPAAALNPFAHTWSLKRKTQSIGLLKTSSLGRPDGPCPHFHCCPLFAHT